MTAPKPIERSGNPDLRGPWPALLRAAQRARAPAISRPVNSAPARA